MSKQFQLKEGSLVPIYAEGKSKFACKTYKRLVRRCSSENEINRLHISLTNRLTPIEAVEIWGTIDTSRCMSRFRAWLANRRHQHFPAFPETSKLVWQTKISDWLVRGGKRSPERYSRFRIAPQMVLYSDPDTRPKSLIVAFADSANRLLMPIPVFLQHLAAAQYDLLLVTDPWRKNYLGGIPGVASGFIELANVLSRILDRAAYESTIAFGTSAGGLPALTMATLLGFNKGVSVGGAGPRSVMWPSLIKILHESELSCANLLAIYSNDFDIDREAGLALRHLGINTLAVRSKTTRLGHNVLFPILAEGKLNSFLDTVFDPSVLDSSDEGRENLDTYVTRGPFIDNELRPRGAIRAYLDLVAQKAHAYYLRHRD